MQDFLNSLDYTLLGSILIGMLAGFIAGKLMRGGGFGCLLNLVLGVIGGVVGSYVLDYFDITWQHSVLARLGTSVLGASLILLVASLFNRKH